MKRPSPRQQKIASVYDADIWPLGPLRAAEPLLRALPRRPRTVALEYGCATGRLARAVAERLDVDSRVVAVDPSPAMIDVANTTPEPKVTFQAADLSPLPVPAGSCDLAYSNLAFGELPKPAEALADFTRALKPAGKALVTLPMRGSWAEFLDLYRDVVREHGKHDALAALQAYEKTLPDSGTATRWMETAGLTNVTLETVRWELLFKSAREFFFAPIVELGPLPTWKQITGGRGGEMQDVFFFVKEAIETYFSGMVFSVTMVVGLLQGDRRD
jgi:ubiquinone/menaquinone biosynthesis C-methylase UbiE